MQAKVLSGDEEGRVHRDLVSRRTMLADLRRTLDDFSGDLDAYNAHLEHVEDLVADRAAGQDVAARVSAYRVQLTAQCAQLQAQKRQTMDVDEPVHVHAYWGPLVPASPQLPLCVTCTHAPPVAHVTQALRHDDRRPCGGLWRKEVDAGGVQLSVPGSLSVKRHRVSAPFLH